MPPVQRFGPSGFIASRIGIPKIGRARLAGSGFFTSMPGSDSHDTIPHNAPAQSTIRTRAVRSATSHSPLASALKAVAGNAMAARMPRRIRPAGVFPGRRAAARLMLCVRCALDRLPLFFSSFGEKRFCGSVCTLAAGIVPALISLICLISWRQKTSKTAEFLIFQILIYIKGRCPGSPRKDPKSDSRELDFLNSDLKNLQGFGRSFIFKILIRNQDRVRSRSERSDFDFFDLHRKKPRHSVEF